MRNTPNVTCPTRVQRKRVKGWRMPDNTVSVCRPGKWGNPFRVGEPVREQVNPSVVAMSGVIDFEAYDRNEPLTAEQACALYAHCIEFGSHDLSELRGKNLACFCAEGSPCHADILLRVANQ